MTTHRIKKPEEIHNLHYYIDHIRYDITSLIKWLVLAVLTGLSVGFISSLFARVLKFVTNYRTEHFWVFFLLPVSGLIIVFCIRNSVRKMAEPIRFYQRSVLRMMCLFVLLR